MAWQTPAQTAERWTRFADAIIDGQLPREAVVTAGYPSRNAHNLGSELLAKPEIQALIDTRRSMLVSRTDWTPQRVVQELASIAQQARDDGQLSVARQCYRDIGEHIGMWPRHPISIDARSQVLNLGDDVIEAIGGIDGLRALASGSVLDDSPVEPDSGA